MESRLLLVTRSGSVNDLYSLIQAEPHILENVDVLPFIHTPLHEASSTGKIDLAMELLILKPSFAKKLNTDGFSPLHIAVENQQVELALELVKFDPSLVRLPGRGGVSPLHLVAKNGNVDLLTEFLQACPESIRDLNVNGETALHITVINNRYKELKVLTRWLQRRQSRDALSTEIYVLDRPDRQVSSTGKIDMAMELMILKPSFAKKLNAKGFSPLHLAVENNQVDLALELVNFDPSLVRIHGRGGMTPLHLAAKKGDLDLLTEFLLVCPDSIGDANINGETALHITVIYNRYEELKVLTGWMQRMRCRDALSTEIHVLNKCDREGSTALHLAAYKNDHHIVKQLLKCMSLNRNNQNKSGMTALDVLRAKKPHMGIVTEKMIQKAGGKSSGSISKFEKTSVFLRKPVTFKEYCSTGMARYRSRMSDGTRNALLVITALIVTATYQTALQPLDINEIKYITLIDYILMVVQLCGLNTIAFFLAIFLTFILLPVGRAYKWWYIFISAPLACSYAISVYLKFRENIFIYIFLFMYVIIVFGVLIYLLIFYVKWKRTTQKKVPNPKSELISRRLQDHD